MPNTRSKEKSKTNAKPEAVGSKDDGLSCAKDDSLGSLDVTPSEENIASTSKSRKRGRNASGDSATEAQRRRKSREGSDVKQEETRKSRVSKRDSRDKRLHRPPSQTDST